MLLVLMVDRRRVAFLKMPMRKLPLRYSSRRVRSSGGSYCDSVVAAVVKD
jgi:hypothetical protein